LDKGCDFTMVPGAGGPQESRRGARLQHVVLSELLVSGHAFVVGGAEATLPDIPYAGVVFAMSRELPVLPVYKFRRRA
jgi:hypothetical protein